jgi:fumarate hydratase subunit alpha
MFYMLYMLYYVKISAVISTMKIDKIKKQVEKIVARAAFELPADVSRLIKKAYSVETNKRAKQALRWILDNARIAKKENLAICQDTGLPIVFLEAGSDIRVCARDIEAVKKGIESGYAKSYLRASAVGPLKRGASFYGGAVIHLDFIPGVKGLKITILPKGFGSENKSALKMFNPTVSIEAIEDFIVDAARRAGPESCPPFIVGVGIGSTADGALLLAKKALLQDLAKPNFDGNLAAMEKRILEKINRLEIGPMGLGGKTTALAVKILKAPTHIAGLPVGVNIGCHALRRATAVIK